ncbi:hypothetical protein AWM75_00880 [Aerococcus urinaehominis]|uniref:Uncharacterized protein n=1 Tax=Aerococcus urinaehominis TaxID=128944 RepID=A0A109RGD9_9LACT|nr:LURP-one-related family protein [Aerococcus urinaehominis]AMB98634.1 hypothetical protein AWM75_00880 [Aerococcus urinaehominis]SDL96221.1 Uncharacterized protein YxjI [Aerococcus urinaehominis]
MTRKLTFRQKIFQITDKYWIKDQDGNKAYQVDQDLRLIGDKIHVNDANKEPIFTVTRKIIRLFPTYEIEFTSGETIKVRSQLSFMKRKLKVTSDDFKLQVKGNLIDYKFKIYQDGDLIGSIGKKMISIGDSYVVTVENTDFEQVLVGIAIAIDNLMDQEDAEEADEE